MSRLQEQQLRGFQGTVEKVDTQLTQMSSKVQSFDGALSGIRKEVLDVREAMALQQQNYAQRYERLEELLRSLHEHLQAISSQPPSLVRQAV